MTDHRAAYWRCRKGWHSWVFESMSDVRDIDGPWGPFTICTLAERCRRCRVKRTKRRASIPRTVRVDVNF